MEPGGPRFRVLGPLDVVGRRKGLLLAALLAARGATVPADVLVELLWGDDPPRHPPAALHTQIARLRSAVGGAIVTRAPGYALVVERGQVDADRFEDLVAAGRDHPDPDAAVALLDEALALWRGPAYAGFADRPGIDVEAIRLQELRLEADELLAARLVAAGRLDRAIPRLEAFVHEHPLREAARATLMRALDAAGRQGDALRQYQEHRRQLVDELGIEPSVALRRLELEILRQDAAAPDAPAPLDDLAVSYLAGPDGHRVAHATLGAGPAVVAIPAWVSSLDVIASGRDPRSSLLERLARSVTLTLYDRHGTGRSRSVDAPAPDYSLAATVDELEAVLEATGPAALLAVSQAGPAAVTVAVRRPDLVTHLVLFGTFADGPATFSNRDMTRAGVDLLRAHWGMGSTLFAQLYRPGASDAATQHFAGVLRDSASGEVAAGYLATMYDSDVSDLLPQVRVPTLVMHYRDDRVVPLRGGRQLADGIPLAAFVAFDGRHHLPDAGDLPRIVDAIVGFVSDDRRTR